MNAVEFQNVDIIFGDGRGEAVRLLDDGGDRNLILQETGCVVGVADASIAIREGEICVLMGLSGSGKSTLLRAVNGLNTVTRGKVLVNDGAGTVDIATCGAATLRRIRMERVAMVFQHFALLPWRTVAENVGFGLEIRGIPKEERDRLVAEKLELVQLAQWKDKFTHELSGGMQQRVGLARAISTDAEILLMDEPFSALDPLIRNHLQDELLELQRRLKKTIIFVSHDLDEALKLGSHIAIMEAGRIVQYGTPEEIVLAPANAYVAEFVAHMNPLNVLRGASLMTPLDDIRRDGEQLLLDWSGHHRMTIAPDGTPKSVIVDDKPGELAAYSEDLDLSALCLEAIVTAGPDIKLRTVIEIRHETGSPVVFVADGKVIGVIGDDEIYQGILRQSNLSVEAE